jgi:hypothetical protein
LRALGHRTSFTPAALGDALARLLTPETELAYLSVDSDRGFDIARRARQLAAALGAAAAAELQDDADELDGDEPDDDDDDDDADSDAEEP